MKGDSCSQWAFLCFASTSRKPFWWVIIIPEENLAILKSDCSAFKLSDISRPFIFFICYIIVAILWALIWIQTLYFWVNMHRTRLYKQFLKNKWTTKPTNSSFQIRRAFITEDPKLNWFKHLATWQAWLHTYRFLNLSIQNHYISNRNTTFWKTSSTDVVF